MSSLVLRPEFPKRWDDRVTIFLILRVVIRSRRILLQSVPFWNRHSVMLSAKHSLTDRVITHTSFIGDICKPELISRWPKFRLPTLLCTGQRHNRILPTLATLLVMIFFFHANLRFFIYIIKHVIIPFMGILGIFKNHRRQTTNFLLAALISLLLGAIFV